MKMIVLDSTNSPYASLEEEMLIAVLCAIKSVNDVVHIKNDSRKETVGISFTNHFLKVSISSENEIVPSLSTIFEELFEKPKETFWKQSSLTTGIWIYYMIWDPSVCNEMIEAINLPTLYNDIAH